MKDCNIKRILYVVSVLSLFFILAGFGVNAQAGFGYCYNTPPKITNITYSIDGGTESTIESSIHILEGEEIAILVYVYDEDGDSVNFTNQTDYVWNGSSPPAVNIYTYAPGVGRLQYTSTNYFDDRETFYMTYIVSAIDNSSCSNNQISQSTPLAVYPFDNLIQIPEFTPNSTSLTINESDNITFIVKYYEPDNDPSLWINYPDVFEPWNNRSIDDDFVYIQWIIDDVLMEYRNFTDYRVNGTTIFNYSTDFLSSGIHTIQFVANSTPRYFDTTQIWTVGVNNLNRAPMWIGEIPDFSWYQHNTFRAFYLNDYVYDADVDIMDGDSLRFLVNRVSGESINVRIDPTSPHLVVFSQPDEFNGSERISITAIDSHGESNTSNTFTLNVLPLYLASTSGQDTGEEGTIGETGTVSPQSPSSSEDIECEEQWYCTKWVCKPDNTMYRTCYDLNYCGTEKFKPDEIDECEYIPECFDGIQNQGEDGVDCGGPCPPCWTCYDRLQNQGEEGIDCGGPCKACPNCSDGILNQGEDEVDCGGPCPSCGNCNDGIKNQDEQDIDCGGSCKPCTAPRIDMGVNLKVGKYPLQYITLVSLSMTLLIIFITLTLKYGSTFIGGLSHFVGHNDAQQPKKEKQQLPAAKDYQKEAQQQLRKLEKVTTNYSNRDIDALTKTVRTYFLSRYRLDSGFTVQELKIELRKTNISSALSSVIVSFLSKLSNISYSGQTLHGSEFRSLVMEAKELVILTSPKDALPQRSSVKKAVKVRVASNSPEEVFRLISLSYERLSQGKSHEAGEIYHTALDLYEKLPERPKQDIYGSLKRLHDEIDLFENHFSS